MMVQVEQVTTRTATKTIVDTEYGTGGTPPGPPSPPSDDIIIVQVMASGRAAPNKRMTYVLVLGILTILLNLLPDNRVNKLAEHFEISGVPLEAIGSAPIVLSYMTLLTLFLLIRSLYRSSLATKGKGISGEILIDPFGVSSTESVEEDRWASKAFDRITSQFSPINLIKLILMIFSYLAHIFLNLALIPILFYFSIFPAIQETYEFSRPMVARMMDGSPVSWFTAWLYAQLLTMSILSIVFLLPTKK
jgi:hypothetical protein